LVASSLVISLFGCCNIIKVVPFRIGVVGQFGIEVVVSPFGIEELIPFEIEVGCCS